MKLKLIQGFIILMISTSMIISCKQIDVFEKNVPIPDYEWSRGFGVTGSFEIQDTTSFYNIYIILRHTDSYNYNNIWLNIGIKSPGDSMNFQKVDLSLGNDREGWEGTGLNDIWEVRKLLFGQARRFIKTGTYEFEIRHIMRDEPLPDVLSAGIRVEKVP